MASVPQKFLIIVCGLPGTGKSTIAKILAGRMRARLLRTDVIRKKLFRQPRYNAKDMDLVYRKLFLLTQKAVKTRHIILDATFSSAKHRKTARRIAEHLGRRFMAIETVCSIAVVRRRLDKRTHHGVSDARFAQYLAMRSRFEKIREPHYVIDTSRGIINVNFQITRFMKQLLNNY